MLRKSLFLIVALLSLCFAGECYAQGQVSRPGKQTSAPAKTQKSKPQKSKPQSKPSRQESKPAPAQSKPVAPIQINVSSPDGYYNNHGYVDLGLPSGTKWATCNIGSSAPEKFGTYFAWGETSPKSIYTGANSLYALKRPAGLLQGDHLAPAHDAAHVNWGSPWRMPTRAEMKELVDRCTWRWVDAPAGMMVTGPNGHSIFLPASGAKYENEPLQKGDPKGCIWGASIDDPHSDSNASEIYFSNWAHWECGAGRAYGFNIRPVCR